MNSLSISFFVLLASYLLGAIPFGVLAGKLGGVDVRSVGSGNVGTTNVWRALGPVAGLTVFALDVAKGAAGPLLGLLILGKNAPWIIALCALLAVLGHIFSVFLKFKGGKGIATGLGAMLGLWWPGALAAFAVWLVLFLMSRMVSVASIAACIFLPFFALYLRQPMPYILMITIFCLVAILKHIPNMKRIAAGTESRVSFGRRKSTFEQQTPEEKV
jgi:glycerol-3-phosphate acyltransferase PlsY